MNQSEAILSHLRSGKSLTPLEALDLFGCFRLGARVYDLKAQGHDIEMEMVTMNGKSFAKYFIPKKPVQTNLFSAA